MSFASEVKAELCRDAVGSRTLAVAECCGVLLFCHTFTPREIRVVTASGDFAERLPRLIKRASGAAVPEAVRVGGRWVLSATDGDTLARVFSALDIDTARNLSHHVNLGLLEEPGCSEAFLRGAFLAGGSVTDPVKGYHMEVTTTHQSVARETDALMREVMGFPPKTAQRGGGQVLYLKQSELISDFLTYLGAPVAAMGIMEARLEKELNNKVNRRCNCDDANTSKVVEAAQEQLIAVRILKDAGLIENLPAKLKQAAVAREENPSASLSELAAMMDPPITKPAMNNRMKKLLQLSKETVQ